MIHLLAVLVKEVVDVVPRQHEPPTDIAQAMVVLFRRLLFRSLLFRSLLPYSLSAGTFIRKVCDKKHISFQAASTHRCRTINKFQLI